MPSITIESHLFMDQQDAGNQAKSPNFSWNISISQFFAPSHAALLRFLSQKEWQVSWVVQLVIRWVFMSEVTTFPQYRKQDFCMPLRECFLNISDPKELR